MNVQDLIKLLENTPEPLEIFSNIGTLRKYNLSFNDFFDITSNFLTDEEKLKLFNYPYFQNFDSWVKFSVIELITDDKVKFNILQDDNISRLFQPYQLVNFIKSLNDNFILHLLYNKTFIEEHNLTSFNLNDIIFSLTSDDKAKLLLDSDYILNSLHISEYYIAELIASLENDDAKINLLSKYILKEHYIVDIIKTLSDSNKIKLLLEERCFSTGSQISLLASLNIDSILNFFLNNITFFKETNIKPYEIIRKLDNESQKRFVSELDNLNLSLAEKKEILVTLNPDVKKEINFSSLSKECLIALNIDFDYENSKIILDFNRNLEDYRHLDNLIEATPEFFNEEERKLFLKLCSICPNLQAFSTFKNCVTFPSTGSEYIDGEEWISNILDSLKPEFSQAQKIAIIDNAIGKRISYSPDFETEVSNWQDCRALWKIISSGYGVCNGISMIEQYMLSRIGVESDFINSEHHSFLKLKNIELPLADGTVIKGNTILDPTWNLSNHRFNGKPNNFCIDYKTAREHDIDDNKLDTECHKNDYELSDATLCLDEKSLKLLFKSVGLTLPNGNFPIKKLIDMSEDLDKLYANDPHTNIKRQFLLLKKYCPEFASCQNSTIKILSEILLNNQNLDFDRCVISRVYDKKDTEKKPVLFIFIESSELGRQFYYVDKVKSQFIELPESEFLQQFDCYQMDIAKNNRI